MFQVMFKDENGRNIMSPAMEDSAKTAYLQVLKNSGIEYYVLDCEAQKHQVVSVIFKLDDTNMYTFDDPNNIAKVGDIVEVECTDGRRKNVLVKAVGMRTDAQIAEYCKKIGYKALGKVIRLVWRPGK